MWVPVKLMNIYLQIQIIPTTMFILIIASHPQISLEENLGSSAPGSGSGSGSSSPYFIEKEDSSQNNEYLDDDGLTIELPQGKIKGRFFTFKNDRLVGGFLGIPYAEPPIGQLRFRPPMPPKTWDGVLNVTDFTPICHQPGEQKIYDAVSVRNRSMIRKRKLENYVMSEDCLTLNVYVPLIESNGNIASLPGELGKLPVFFYIHGGSYYMGSGRFYPGQILASSQNLIVITFNFRLGPLGFFSTGDRAAPGNYGFLDQVQALNWVRDNIHLFGGDPHRITLVGNSAGGASVMFHLVSHLSKDKFIGITVQSGCSGAPWAIQPSPKKHAESLAIKLGCPTIPTTDMVDCIRTFSPKQIMKNANLEDGLSLAYAAVIDGKYGGKFLSGYPDKLIQQNQFHHVPILTGFTKDEVTIWFTKWGPSSPTKHLKDFLKHDVVSLLQNDPSLTHANHAAAFHSVKVQYMYKYGILENDTLGKTSAVSDFISDVGLKAPCIHEMNRVAQYNTKPIYLYEFHYFSVDDVKMNRQEWIGSYHESELQFIFGEPYLNYSNHLKTHDDKKMSDLMMKIWANFVRYGNPTPSPKGERTGLKFLWTNYTERNQDFAILGLKSHMEKYFYTDRMLFWNFFFPMFRDYKFDYTEPSPYECDDWELLKKSWTFWILVCITCCLSFIVSICISCHFKNKQQQQSSHHHHQQQHRTRITKWYKNNTNTNINNTLIPTSGGGGGGNSGGGGGINSPCGGGGMGGSSSPLNSSTCHPNALIVSIGN